MRYTEKGIGRTSAENRSHNDEERRWICGARSDREGSAQAKTDLVGSLRLAKVKSFSSQFFAYGFRRLTCD